MKLKNSKAQPTIPDEEIRVSKHARKAADRAAGRSLVILATNGQESSCSEIAAANEKESE